MQEWGFRSTPLKAGLDRTYAIVARHGFICRSRYEIDSEHKRKADLVDRVKARDLVHFYYRGGPKPADCFSGIYQVLDSAEFDEESAPSFGHRVENTALWTVVSGALLDLLKAMPDDERSDGFVQDPWVGAFCGWPVHRVKSAIDYDQVKHRFGPRQSLVKWK